MQIRLLQELRSVSQEVGGIEPARKLPTEVRKWWVEQIEKEKEQFPVNPGVSADGRTVVRTAPKTPPKGF